jgi:RHS repeat-associated protein
VAQSAINSTDVGGAEPYWAEYGYDALGNRVSLVDHGVSGSPSTVTTTYQHGHGGASAHQVTSVMSSAEGSPLSEVAFEYDDAGNRVAATSGAETNSYAWDVEGELVADDDYEYVYDASGSRVVRSGADGLTVYLPGGQEITIEGTTVSATRYYSFAGSTVAVRSGKGLGGVTSLVSDRDGSVVAAVPNTVWTATSVERVYADPFGGVRGASDAGVPGDRRFLGGTLDAASGLTLLGARYYDAALGRFISVDPLLNLGVPGHFNAYSYAYGNPMTFSDPSGLEPAGEKIGLGKNGGGGAGKKPPSTSWAALAACSDFWCQQGWHFSTGWRAVLGVGKGLGELLWTASTVKVVVEDVIPMISDWDGYWARKNEQLQADVDFWSGPDPVGELGNSLWNSVVDAWQNDPGMLVGEGVAAVGSAAIPGGLAIKGLSAANKVGNAARAASTGGALGGFEQGAAKVPTAWGQPVPNRNAGGIRWTDPQNQGNGVRIDHGVPGSPFPSQQVDHVVVRSAGNILGPDGSAISGALRNNPQAHIPLVDWLEWTTWNSPK